MGQNESQPTLMRGPRRYWIVGILAFTIAFLLWHQSYTITNIPPLNQISNNDQIRPVTPYASSVQQSQPPKQSSPASTSPTQISPSYTAPAEDYDFEPLPTTKSTSTVLTKSSQESSTKWLPSPLSTTHPTFAEDAPQYVKAILDPTDTTITRLECPRPLKNRYDYLATANNTVDVSSKPPSKQQKYFFALNLKNCTSLLPTLLGSVVEAIRFLGPEHCVLSIIEGHSDDGTPEILSALQPNLESLGIATFFSSSDINPVSEGNDRIAQLAALRNLALAPLVQNAHAYALETIETTVVFVNDVALCHEDILEVIHQRHIQSADMICAMDWIFGGSSFYDVWVSRGINGDQFFEIPQDGGWDFASNLFWNAPRTRRRLDLKLPFQVFSCWNGMTAFTASPLLKQQIEFRSSLPDGKECYLGEPLHFAKDMWYHNYTRVAVVPSVNLGYSWDQSIASKNANGWTGETVQIQIDSVELERTGKTVEADETTKGKVKEVEMIKWKDTPPELIKCVPSYQNVEWVRWDQGLDELYGNSTRTTV